jgi:hypothetical protein
MTHITLQRGLAVLLTLGLLVVVFELVRRKRLSERYAILWLLAAITLFVLAVWKGLLTSLSSDVGISYPPSLLFTVAIGLIAIILLHFSIAVSRLSDQNKVLAQRLGLLQQRVEDAEHSSVGAGNDLAVASERIGATEEPEQPVQAGSGHGGARSEPVAVEKLSRR